MDARGIHVTLPLFGSPPVPPPVLFKAHDDAAEGRKDAGKPVTEQNRGKIDARFGTGPSPEGNAHLSFPSKQTPESVPFMRGESAIMEDTQDYFYQSLLMINNALVSEKTPEGLFRNLVMAIQPLIRCDRCSLTIYDPKTDQLKWFARAEGVIITSMDDSIVPLRGPFCQEALQRGEPFLIPDLTKYKKYPAVQRMIDAGLQWHIALPLLSRGQSIGVLSVSFVRRMTTADRQMIFLLEKISQQVALAVDNFLAHEKLREMNVALSRHVNLLRSETEYDESCFFYHCESMQSIVEQAGILARSSVPVLICGETGTGKDLLAHFIHNNSLRSSHNFVKINCPALSNSLFESELFGHARGAFTGATAQRAGRFEVADKGSVFLDEIGELGKPLQAKLLQVLQESCFERVGDSHPIKVDIRFISATNAPLEQLMEHGEFREDLFYRLATTVIHIPPLRERQGEIPGLLKHIQNQLTREMNCQPLTFSTDAIDVLQGYSWPGNLREFSNLLKRLLLLYPGRNICAEQITPLFQRQAVPAPQQIELPAATGSHPGEAVLASHSTGFALVDVECRLIEKVLSLTNGIVSGKNGAAALLGLPRSTLLYKLRKYGIAPKKFGASTLLTHMPAQESMDMSFFKER